MPYRVDLDSPPDDTFDRLVELGALDVEPVAGGIAAIMPDAVPADTLARAFGQAIRVSADRARDDGSVWVVMPRAVRVGRWQIIPADWPPQAGALRMIDAPAFGTGLHPTTELCLAALDRELDAGRPARVLDVGTGTGVLALAALWAGVPHATAIDIDPDAVRAAADNARLNGLSSRLALVRGGPDAVSGVWPLVLANVLAAPLIEMAPVLARRLDRKGRIVLSGIRSSLAGDVEQVYRRVGLRHVTAETREGWSALTLSASW